MKTLKSIIFIFLLSTSFAAFTQENNTRIISFEIVKKNFSEKSSVFFDIDESVLLNGLNKKELDKKFNKTESLSGVINFVVSAGYNLLQTVAINGGSGFGNSDGTIGYLVIFEKKS